MSMNVQQRGDKFQLRVKHRLMPKPFFRTFDTETEATTYGTQLEAVLARGIVPSELRAPPTNRVDDPLVSQVIGEYCEKAPVTSSDDELLSVIVAEVAGLRVSGVTMKWAEDYVARLKTPKVHLAPGTIRKRVGALARVLAWHYRRVTPDGQNPPVNALTLLPRGYSGYTKNEAAALASVDKVAKRDTIRDRRLPPEEEARVRAALAGEKRPDRERSLQVDPEFSMLLDLILATGMRLRETNWMRVEKIDFGRRIIHVDGSKGHRGVIKPRTVPMTRALADQLQAFVGERTSGLVFGFWDGTAEDLDRCSGRLTARFSKLFEYAQVEGMTEHDLRHEATCRWFTMRDAAGRWVFSDIEICRIMGWTDTRIALRYASLRGEDLAARLLD